jgi:hypothetical protein
MDPAIDHQYPAVGLYYFFSPVLAPAQPIKQNAVKAKARQLLDAFLAPRPSEAMRLARWKNRSLCSGERKVDKIEGLMRQSVLWCRR